jgi:predicted transcriptional regulator
MTREDIVRMFEMRIDGATYEEIGKEFGVTRERIRQILEKNIKQPIVPVEQTYIYPGLRNWMLTNGCNANKLRNETNVCKTMTGFYNKLKGRSNFSINEIKTLLSYTGLTFEEAFGTVEANACEQ